jgi:hypothetical protein
VGQVFAYLALTQAVFSGSHAGALANRVIWIALLHLGNWTLAVFPFPRQGATSAGAAAPETAIP